MEITNVLYAFARLVDEGTLEQVGALFTDDIEWSMTGAIWRGREEVLAGLGSMRELGHAGPESGNRHVVTNQEVHVSDDEATARSYFLLVSRDAPSIVAIGAYRDVLRREDDRWLLARREVTT
ncbi:nuclear transport factor 2 family protein [Amycolatopsis lurida]